MSRASERYHKEIKYHNEMLDTQKDVKIICYKCKKESPINISMAFVFGDSIISICFDCLALKEQKYILKNGYWRF
jgi:hypothetical protein